MVYSKRSLFVSAMSLALSAGASFTASAQFVPPNIDFGVERPIEALEVERYIIRYKKSGKSKISSQIAQGKGQVKMSVDGQNMVAATLPKGYARALKGDPNILSIEIDPRRYLMAEETPYGIGMVQANQLSDAATGNRTVCIMDTGYDRQHVDLQAVRVTGNDGYGSVNSGNWYTDGDGHGTHVAGTIAALGGNNEGVVGVNPGNNLNLHIIKVFNNNGNWAYGSDLVKAVDQCMSADANVISMSLGGEGASAAEEAAFDQAKNAGLLSIAAAGNDGIAALNYPASYDSVVSVAAVNSAGTVASFSQKNAQVEIAAPGVNVKSTIPNNQYDTYSGTSMATPHVAGVAALVWSHYPDCTGEQIRAALNNSALDKGTAGRDNKYGYGIVKAKNAYDALASGCGTVTPPPPPPPPPTGSFLENGVPTSQLSKPRGEKFRIKMVVPAGASNLSLKMSGGTGDADLYVRKGEPPSLSNYDCRPYKVSNNETCNFASPGTDTYHVMISAYEAFSGVTLVGSFTDPASGTNNPPVSRFTFNCSGLSCDFDASASTDSDGTIASYWWKFESGATGRDKLASHSFSAPGTYRVLLVTKDNDGDRGRLRKNVTVR